MNQRRNKKVVHLVGVAAALLPLFVASFAYACTSLATLSLHPAQGDIGATISGEGKNFRAHSGEATSNEPVIVRFGSRSGPVLWSGPADAGGTVRFSFTVPQAQPGQYTIIATQNDANGRPVSGTPARASFEVKERPVATAPQSSAPGDQQQPTAAPSPAVNEEPAPSATEQSAPTPAPRLSPAPRTVRLTPTPAQSRAPLTPPAVPAAATAAPATEASPSPATPAPGSVAPVPPAPAPELSAAPAAPAGESASTARTSDGGGAPWLVIGLVGVGLLLSVGATAMVLAGRRERKALAQARR